MDCIPQYLAPRRNVVYGKPINISEAADELKQTADLIMLINSNEKKSEEDLRFAVGHGKDILHAIGLQFDAPGILFAPDEEDRLKRKKLTKKYMEIQFNE